MKKILCNNNGDKYIKTDVSLSKDKKKDIEYWDQIDDEARLFIEKIALMAGIQISDWGNEDAVKEVVELTIKLIEERFNVEFPFIDEDY